jgi:hypothetical protein
LFPSIGKIEGLEQKQMKVTKHCSQIDLTLAQLQKVGFRLALIRRTGREGRIQNDDALGFSRLSVLPSL